MITFTGYIKVREIASCDIAGLIAEPVVCSYHGVRKEEGNEPGFFPAKR